MFQHEEEPPHGVGKESSAEQTEKLSKTALKNKRKREAKQKSKEQEVHSCTYTSFVDVCISLLPPACCWLRVGCQWGGGQSALGPMLQCVHITETTRLGTNCVCTHSDQPAP